MDEPRYRVQCGGECGDGIDGFWVLDDTEKSRIVATCIKEDDANQIAAALNAIAQSCAYCNGIGDLQSCSHCDGTGKN